MNQTVAEVMTRDPITVTRETSLTEAIKIIAEKRISGLPVVDDNGKLVGVISETDLMWKETGIEPPPYVMFLDSVIYLENPARYEKEVHKALGQTVGEVMTAKAISIDPQSSVKDAARLMHDKHVRRLPVVNEAAQVVGIITRGDIVRSMAGL
ncbi:MAG: CBS domain-containing protein [Gloeocapsa sp. DLM2.Bin57]|nr:MAG: CBS domain-containing protein [Gloeocapsa sp. DLM2.Bin57]